MMHIRRSRTLAMAALGVILGLLAAVSAPAVASAKPAFFAVDIRSGADGIAISTTYPGMAACEAVPTQNCYHFTDGTVVGQLVLSSAIYQLLGILGIHTSGCTTIGNVGGGSPLVDEIYVNSAEPLVFATGTCADLARDVENHSIVLAVPFQAELIAPNVVSVEDLRAAVTQPAGANQKR